MEQVARVDDRGYFRVRCTLGVRVQPVAPERWAAEEAAILAERSVGAGPIDAELARWLERIERKLDLVLERMEIDNPEARVQLEQRAVELSGSGIRLPDGAALAPGSGVRLELSLGDHAAEPIHALGRVVASSGERARSGCAIRFEVIREVDRDRIVEHTLEVERQRIRARGSDTPA